MPRDRDRRDPAVEQRLKPCRTRAESVHSIGILDSTAAARNSRNGRHLPVEHLDSGPITGETRVSRNGCCAVSGKLPAVREPPLGPRCEQRRSSTRISGGAPELRGRRPCGGPSRIDNGAQTGLDFFLWGRERHASPRRTRSEKQSPSPLTCYAVFKRCFAALSNGSNTTSVFTVLLRPATYPLERSLTTSGPHDGFSTT